MQPGRQARWRLRQVKLMRPVLGFSPVELSARRQIPPGTLSDWEQGKAESHQALEGPDNEIVRRAL
jgi:DNA-binding transcriptional regulator YiaG